MYQYWCCTQTTLCVSHKKHLAYYCRSVQYRNNCCCFTMELQNNAYPVASPLALGFSRSAIVFRSVSFIWDVSNTPEESVGSRDSTEGVARRQPTVHPNQIVLSLVFQFLFSQFWNPILFTNFLSRDSNNYFRFFSNNYIIKCSASRSKRQLFRNSFLSFNFLFPKFVLALPFVILSLIFIL